MSEKQITALRAEAPKEGAPDEASLIQRICDFCNSSEYGGAEVEGEAVGNIILKAIQHLGLAPAPREPRSDVEGDLLVALKIARSYVPSFSGVKLDLDKIDAAIAKAEARGDDVRPTPPTTGSGVKPPPSPPVNMQILEALTSVFQIMSRLVASSDSEMEDGDLARRLAEEWSTLR